MWKLLCLILLLITVNAFAGDIPAPPPLPQETPVEQDYFQKIYNNWNNLKGVTVNPDGVTQGKKNDMVILYTGGNIYLEVNTDGGTTWRGVILTNTP